MNFYILAGNTNKYKYGEIVSSHRDKSTAEKKANDFNTKADIKHITLPHFFVVESKEKLDKGKCYSDLADSKYKESKSEFCLSLMKSYLRPEQNDCFDNQRIAEELSILEMSFSDLKGNYEARALADLDDTDAVFQKTAEQKARQTAVQSEIADATQEYCFKFPAARGVQAGCEYFVAQVPFATLAKIFRFDDDLLPVEYRAQRILNEKRAQEIGQYILDNPDDYVLPAITVSVSNEMFFEHVEVTGASNRLGLLNIPMDATLLINDGQHRRAGIEYALKEKPELKQETISVTLFFDHGLKRSQQMFADINASQAKPSSTITAFYNKRDPFNTLVMDTIKAMPEIEKRIDFENNTPGKKSQKLWSLIAFKKFITQFTGINERNIDKYPESERDFYKKLVISFFDEISKSIHLWSEMINAKISSAEVKERHVIGQAMFLQAMGIFAYQIIHQDISKIDDSFKWDFSGLKNLDTEKTAELWQGRCILNGRMLKNMAAVKTTAAILLTMLGVKLTPEMEVLEAELK